VRKCRGVEADRRQIAAAGDDENRRARFLLEALGDATKCIG
jgi:hypothetical protein